MIHALFAAIWWSAAVLAVASVALMGILVFRRMATERRKDADRKRTSALQPLVFRCIDDPSAIEAVAAGLGPHDTRLIGPLVRGLVDSIAGDDRGTLIDLLQRFGVVRDDIERLRRGKPEQRLQAAMTLGYFGTPEVMAALDAALGDPNIEVRVAAANALLKSDQPVDLGRILEWFEHSRGGFPRSLRNLFVELARRDPESFLPHLDTAPVPALTALIYALGHVQEFDILAKLMRIGVDHASKDVRAETMRALGLIGHPASAPAISRGLADPAWEVRTQAAIAAGRIRLPRLIETLSALMDDTEWWVRFRAAEALGKMGDEGAQALIDRSLGYGNGASVARLALAELGDRE